MKSWARFVFIFVAYSLALLHTVVPHHHPAKGFGDAIITHNGCLLAAHANSGLLQRALSTDLGVGHLETFNKNDVRVDFSPVAASIDAVVSPMPFVADIHLRTTDTHVNAIDKLARQLLLSGVVSFRAPPVA